MRVNLPEEERVKYDVRAMAAHCVATAERHKLVTERAIAAFVLHMVRINPEFYRQPTMAMLLADLRVDEQLRMERLLTDTSEDNWAHAAVMCDPNFYWLPFRVRPPGLPRPLPP